VFGSVALPLPKFIVTLGDLKTQLAGCAFNTKADRRITSMKPNSFNSHALCIKASTKKKVFFK